MFACIHNLAMALLLLTLPWQPFATGMPIGIQDHLNDMFADAERGSGEAYYDKARHDYRHSHFHAAMISADDGSAPSSAMQTEYAEECWLPALPGNDGLLLALIPAHGLVIPFAALPLRWRAPDAIDHRPRTFLLNALA